MNSVYYDVWRRGGLAATHELLRDGHTSHSLTRAVRRGEVVRARQGHYCCPELSAQQIRAVRVGGRLTGLAAAAEHGLWTPQSIHLSVEVAAHARALRVPDNPRVRLATQPGDAAVHWNAAPRTGTRSLVDPIACLVEVVRQHPALIAFAVVESALHKRVVTMDAWAKVLAAMPVRLRTGVESADCLSESGGESLLRFHLLGMGVRPRQQILVQGAGRVDFLIGDGLVIEVDGAQFHTDRVAFEEDRRRDAVLTAAGYRVLRFSYWQVASRWPEVEAAIRAAMSRGDHCRPAALPK